MPGDYIGVIPELVTSRLQAGPGALPWGEASGAYAAKAAAYAAQASQYGSLLGQAEGAWQSPAGMKALASAARMTIWLGTASGLSAKASLQAAEQGAAYSAAYVGVPQMEEMAENHVTNAVLNATNFFGVNTAPIAANEFDYLVRMTTQAATVMAGFETSTMANLMSLGTFVPPEPMTAPGVGVQGLATSGFLAATGLPGKISRDAIFAAVGAESMFSTGRQQGGRLAATVGEAEQKAQAASFAAGLANQQAAGQATEDTAGQAQQMSQIMPMAQQMMQAPQQLMQAPQQLMQGPQQMMSPLQQIMSQMTSMFQGGAYGADATGAPVDQIGLLGASPITNHPAVGGSGLAGGAGLLTGASLPGAGGTSARTPLLASMNTASATALSGQSEVATSAQAARTGGVPMGAMPMGAMAGHKKEEDTAEGITAPGVLAFDDELDELDDWSA